MMRVYPVSVVLLSRRLVVFHFVALVIGELSDLKYDVIGAILVVALLFSSKFTGVVISVIMHHSR